ncbi:MAG: 30S ribosomal protein S9 [candidate division WOR-3 bacterium]
MSEKKKVHEAGKRKTAYARTTVKEGKGSVRINSVPLDVYGNELLRNRIREPLIIASEFIDLNKLDINVDVKGGGRSGQVDAVRTSIAKALIAYASGGKMEESLREKLVSYDRSLVSGDSRRTEPHKPSKSSRGPRAKRQKSYR